jgi:hypothetical protein
MEEGGRSAPLEPGWRRARGCVSVTGSHSAATAAEGTLPAIRHDPGRGPIQPQIPKTISRRATVINTAFKSMG